LKNDLLCIQNVYSFLIVRLFDNQTLILFLYFLSVSISMPVIKYFSEVALLYKVI
jgi:hypothetical protein